VAGWRPGQARDDGLNRLNQTFHILHDDSIPLQNEQLILEAMMSEDGNRQTIGFDRRTMQFPIAADGIEFGGSKAFSQLQVADLLSSAMRHFLTAAAGRESDDFSDVIRTSRAMSSPVLPLWPSQAMTPQELGTDVIGGVDPNLHIGEYVSKRLDGIPAASERRKK